MNRESHIALMKLYPVIIVGYCSW